MTEYSPTISVIGLGYVGLPVAVALSKKFKVIGYDIDASRVDQLRAGIDRTGEISAAELQSKSFYLTSEASDLSRANFHIIAVPTPVDDSKRPDLSMLVDASEALGWFLEKGSIVVYESTVYPGATEDVCIPALENTSRLRAGFDFSVGYSPERINPADTSHKFENIKKVVSAQDEETLEKIAYVYGSVIEAGVHRAPSIRVAEAAKVIENTQRDVNIALMNELALIFDRLEIDTAEVLDAAQTKWNFLPFRPGLVGGHCIGVDPYYLTHKAAEVGHHAEVILSGRRINDGMGRFVAQKALKLFAASHSAKPVRATVLGVTFKENCPDIRNSKVFDIISELKEFGLKVQVHDPIADVSGSSVELMPLDRLVPADIVIVAVAHEQYRQLSDDQMAWLCGLKGIIFDVKSILSRESLQAKGLHYFRL